MRRLRAAILALLVALPAATGVAAGSVARASSSHRGEGALAPDTVHGVVFDSLLLRPLAGATVIANPGGISTTTDDQGRFTIGGPQRLRQLAVFHDLLDRTGIGSLSAAVDSSARDALVVATPSIGTLWSRLCPGSSRVRGREGIVFGVARTADGTTRVAGARIRASWESDTLSVAGQASRTVEARTDSIGNFYACGVPSVENLHVIGYSQQFSSGYVWLAGDSVPLLRQDLFLGAAGTTGAVRGLVIDQSRAPLAGATVDVEGLDGSSTTNAAGRFQIANAPTGSRMMLVRAVGHTPAMVPVNVLDRDGEEIRALLERTVVLPAVKVKDAGRSPMRRVEYEERRKSGFGYFLDSAQFKSRFDTRAIFLGAPGVTIDARSLTRQWQMYFPSAAGFCPANIWLDGNRADTSVLEATPKETIAAVEIYSRAMIAPQQYVPSGSSCGVVLVWTKAALRF